MTSPLSVFKPCFGDEELKALEEPFRSGWIGLGPKTAEFEARFAEFCGVSHAVGVNSATAALDLAMRLLGVNHGDEVIVPTITFVSTAHVVAYNLATPIFVDVDPNTLAMDFADLERKLSRRTKAIIPVHYGGRMVDMDRLQAIAGDIPIVEDCAHAAGGYYKGRHAGSFGRFGCFSFHAVKNLAMGDGGALVTNDDASVRRAKRLRWLGIDKDTWERSELDRSYWWEYFVDEIGLKCHMNDIQGAIGLVQLGKLPAMNRRRVEIKNLYLDGLRDLPQVQCPPDDDKVYQSAWHIFSVQAEKRDDLSVYLRDQGIATGVHYKPIHLYRCYGNATVLPNAEAVFPRLLTLPMYPDLQNEDVHRVIDTIRRFYGH
jgi:perosamine synthetase